MTPFPTTSIRKIGNYRTNFGNDGEHALSCLLSDLKSRYNFVHLLRTSVAKRIEHITVSGEEHWDELKLTMSEDQTQALEPRQTNRLHISLDETLRELVGSFDSTCLRRRTITLTHDQCRGMKSNGRPCMMSVAPPLVKYCSDGACRAQKGQCLWLTRVGDSCKGVMCLHERQVDASMVRYDNRFPFCTLHNQIHADTIGRLSTAAQSTLASFEGLQTSFDRVTIPNSQRASPLMIDPSISKLPLAKTKKQRLFKTWAGIVPQVPLPQASEISTEMPASGPPSLNRSVSTLSNSSAPSSTHSREHSRNTSMSRIPKMPGSNVSANRTSKRQSMQGIKQPLTREQVQFNFPKRSSQSSTEIHEHICVVCFEGMSSSPNVAHAHGPAMKFHESCIDNWFAVEEYLAELRLMPVWDTSA